MCNEISNLIVSGNGGVLYFENQISTYQYLRVLRTLSFDPEHQIWAIVLIFPVGEGNKLIDRSIDIVGHSHIDSKVDYEIEIKMEKKSNIVEIVLPQYLPINNWSIEEKEYVNLISYNKTDFPIKDGDMIEGISTAVQKFKIQVSTDETTEILLKWANINEVDKLFKDKKEDYLLKISVSYY